MLQNVKGTRVILEKRRFILIAFKHKDQISPP